MGIKSKTAVAIIFCFSLAGCGIIDTYYVMPRAEVESHIGGVKSEIKGEDDAAEQIKDLAFIFDNMEIYIKTKKSEGFQVDYMSRIDPQKIEGKNFSEKVKKIFGQSEIHTFNKCVYFNDRNWNCGWSELNMDKLKMVNGDLYKDGIKLKRRYRIRI